MKMRPNAREPATDDIIELDSLSDEGDALITSDASFYTASSGPSSRQSTSAPVNLDEEDSKDISPNNEGQLPFAVQLRKRLTNVLGYCKSHRISTGISLLGIATIIYGLVLQYHANSVSEAGNKLSVEGNTLAKEANEIALAGLSPTAIAEACGRGVIDRDVCNRFKAADVEAWPEFDPMSAMPSNRSIIRRTDIYISPFYLESQEMMLDTRSIEHTWPWNAASPVNAITAVGICFMLIFIFLRHALKRKRGGFEIVPYGNRIITLVWIGSSAISVMIVGELLTSDILGFSVQPHLRSHATIMLPPLLVSQILSLSLLSRMRVGQEPPSKPLELKTRVLGFLVNHPSTSLSIYYMAAYFLLPPLYNIKPLHTSLGVVIFIILGSEIFLCFQLLSSKQIDEESLSMPEVQSTIIEDKPASMSCKTEDDVAEGSPIKRRRPWLRMMRGERDD